MKGKAKAFENKKHSLDHNIEPVHECIKILLGFFTYMRITLHPL